MKTLHFLLMVAASSTGTLSALGPAQADDDDARPFEGKWKVVSAERNGGSYPKDMIEKMFVDFDDDEMRVYVEGTKAEQTARFKLDPAKDPKQIDFIEQTRDKEWQRGLFWEKLFSSWKMEGDKFVPAEHKVEGIYKLEGEKLTLCWRTTKGKEVLADKVSQELKVRPTLFRSDLYYHQFLFVLERPRAEQ